MSLFSSWIPLKHPKTFDFRCFQVVQKRISDPIDTGCKLDLHKTLRRCPGRLLNVWCTFNFRPVSTGEEWMKNLIRNLFELSSDFGWCRARDIFRSTDWWSTVTYPAKPYLWLSGLGNFCCLQEILNSNLSVATGIYDLW